MKLLEKNNSRFFRFAALLLLASALLLFVISFFIIRSEIDEELQEKAALIVSQIASGQPVPNLYPVMEVQMLDADQANFEEFSTIELLDPVQDPEEEDEEEEMEPFRQYILIHKINDRTYSIIVRSSLLEADDLLIALGISFAILTLFLFLGLRWLNQYTHRLWQPFHTNLALIKEFNLQERKPLQLTTSDIDEFNELKKVIELLTDKIQKDFRSLKEFTENASHEIQTPLAIISGKVESLIQQNNLSETALNDLSSIYEASLRLSKLNKGLLLLTKLDNNQIGEARKLNLRKVVSAQITHLTEVLAEKKIKFEFDIDQDISLNADPTLINILLKNLFENAIRYSSEGSVIKMGADNDGFSISNPGQNRLPAHQQLFDRFKKDSTNKSSLGLGLSIARKICEVNNWQLKYEWLNQRHYFKIKY